MTSTNSVDCIVDPYGAEVCLPAEFYEPIITYEAKGKRARNQAKWLGSKLTRLGVTMVEADGNVESDVVLKKKMSKDRINQKVFRALESSPFDGDVYVMSMADRHVCVADDDAGTLIVMGDGSWFSQPVA